VGTQHHRFMHRLERGRDWSGGGPMDFNVSTSTTRTRLKCVSKSYSPRHRPALLRPRNPPSPKSTHAIGAHRNRTASPPNQVANAASKQWIFDNGIFFRARCPSQTKNPGGQFGYVGSNAVASIAKNCAFVGSMTVATTSLATAARAKGSWIAVNYGSEGGMRTKNWPTG
jgi:hypothetical protein